MASPDVPSDSDPGGSPPAGDGPGVLGYAWDGRAASALTYGVVLVTRRGRPLFADAAVAGRVAELLTEAASGCGCRLAACEVGPSWVRLEVEAPPTMSPHVAVTHVRRGAAALKGESEAARRLGAVFRRVYLVRTGPVSEADRAAFVTAVSSQ